MRVWRVLTGTFVVLAAVGITASEPTYIGAAKCKLCHKTEYTSWQTMAHAKAFDRLKPEEHTNATCLKCHATGASAEMPGVQCEACHGPGSDYKGLKVMKDPAASAAAGLITPTEASCKGCHQGEAPHDLKPFNFESAKAGGMHAVKEKK